MKSVNVENDSIVEFTNGLPHGSGIDASWNYNATNGSYVYFSNSFHCMDENGFYCGWQDFSVRLDKTLFDYVIDAYAKMVSYNHMPSKERMTERVNSLLDLLAENFTLQFNNGHHLADRHLLRDYLEDTIHYAISECIFKL
jgi:hypothetical protein